MYLRTILPLFSAVFLMGSGVVASPTHASTRNHYHRHHANHHLSLNGDAARLRGPHHQTRYGIEASPFPFAGIFSPSQSTESIGRTGRMGRPFSGSGIASVYSSGRTASGERMNAGAMTAAHRTLPFGNQRYRRQQPHRSRRDGANQRSWSFRSRAGHRFEPGRGADDRCAGPRPGITDRGASRRK